MTGRPTRSVLCLGCLALLASWMGHEANALTLDNEQLGLHFDDARGTLVALHNKRTDEVYHIHGDEISVEAEEFRVDSAAAKLVSLHADQRAVHASYQSGGITIDVTYTLGRERRFAEKRVALTCNRDYALKNVTISRLSFSAADLKIVPYRYQKNVTYFGRTPEGGFFAGVELPFDASSLKDGRLTLGYAPGLKVKAGEKLACEPIYLGVYKRYPGEQPLAWQPFVFTIRRYPGTPKLEVIPLRSESDAMVALTSAVLGPPRHGLVPVACGWHCEMEHHAYQSETAVQEGMKSLDFLTECGIDWVSDSSCWGGETDKMNRLIEGQEYEPGGPVRRLLEHAKEVGVSVVMWSTMNHTHPWWRSMGRPFRPDKPEWIMVPGGTNDNLEVNCFANEPFFQWLAEINMQALRTGYYQGWAMDGSFFGHGGYGKAFVPVNCPSDKHDHLPGDSNYACQRNLDRLMARVRRQDPEIVVFTCGPPMDLGVWSLRNVDICFTIDEASKLEFLEYLPGLKAQPVNVAFGDKIRNWSRVRVHHHFFPHYVDQPLLFPSRSSRNAALSWTSEKLDYILLSALSCSPNQLFYLPTRTGIPQRDKAEIRKWLDWGRKHAEYLLVRQDLPDWPAAGKVDGSAHVLQDRGLVFLFNPNKDSLPGQFALTEQGIGLKKQRAFRIAQVYPDSDLSREASYGETVRWTVPGEGAVVLMVQLRR